MSTATRRSIPILGDQAYMCETTLRKDNALGHLDTAPEDERRVVNTWLVAWWHTTPNLIDNQKCTEWKRACWDSNPNPKTKPSPHCGVYGVARLRTGFLRAVVLDSRVESSVVFVIVCPRCLLTTSMLTRAS